MAKEILPIVVVAVVLVVGASAAGVFDGGSRAYLDYGYGHRPATGGALAGILPALAVTVIFGLVIGALALGAYIASEQMKLWFMAGSEAAQRGRDTDERSTAQQMAALARLAQVAIQIGARSAPADAPIIAPLDTQAPWLPELEEYHRPAALPAPDPEVWDVELPDLE